MNTTISAVQPTLPRQRFWTLRRAALAGMIAPILWCSVLLLLDIIQYNFLIGIGANPLTTAPASENGMGPYGWLYVASDFTLGLLTVLFALGLMRSIKGGVWKWVGMAGMFIFGFGFMIGSAPCECLPGQQVGVWGQIHNWASIALLLTTIPMPLGLGLAFRHDERWRRVAWYSIGTGLSAPVLFVIVNALPPVFSWFYLWLLFIPFAWLAVTAHHLGRLANGEA
ncbi:MAG: DUF998 domain-containing protein [Caldilineaceae bacterium]